MSKQRPIALRRIVRASQLTEAHGARTRRHHQADGASEPDPIPVLSALTRHEKTGMLRLIRLTQLGHNKEYDRLEMHATSLLPGSARRRGRLQVIIGNLAQAERQIAD